MNFLAATLVLPLAGIIILAFIGHRRSAKTVNLIICAATFVTALLLAIEIFRQGPILSASKLFYIDGFNVYLILLNAFVGMTTAIFSGPYMEHEVASE
jgi:hydrogenase-4 component F